jgi:putative DNA primase/helicase
MYDKRHDLWNIQSIALNGFKLFTKGAKVKQCFHPIGLSNKRPSQIVICEGYATGMSIYQATNLPTVVCFAASNLCSVAAVLKRKYLHSSIIVAGDNDQFNERNIGEINTYAAAEFANGKAVFPKFKDLLTKPTDFNDLHCLEGLSEVKRQIVEVCSER